MAASNANLPQLPHPISFICNPYYEYCCSAFVVQQQLDTASCLPHFAIVAPSATACPTLRCALLFCTNDNCIASCRFVCVGKLLLLTLTFLCKLLFFLAFVMSLDFVVIGEFSVVSLSLAAKGIVVNAVLPIFS